MTKIGERVGAILDADEDIVNFFGYGVYEGDFIPEEAVGWIAETIRGTSTVNPRIRLDNGKVVYGCECWWGSERAVRKRLSGRKVIETDIDQVRSSHDALGKEED